MNSNDLAHGFHFLYGQDLLASNKDSLNNVETQEDHKKSRKFDAIDNNHEKDTKKDTDYKVFNEDYQDKLMDEIFIV